MSRDTTPEDIAHPHVTREEVRSAMSSIIGKWKLEILWVLNERTHRFGELRRAIPGATQHMLTRQLRELEADGLLTRVVFAEIPPRVEYSITEKARDLQPAFSALVTWSQQH